MSKRKTFMLGNNAALSYAEYGNPNGFPLLVFHGLVGSIVSEGLEESLKDVPLRCIFLARPGYGESDFFEMRQVLDWAKELKPFIDELGLERFDVAAYSASAPYAYSFAVAYPRQTRHIYINGGLPALYDKEILESYVENAAALYDFFVSGSYETVGKKMAELFFSSLPEEYMNHVDILDAKKDGCKGMAREAKLQSVDWGFDLSDISHAVTMIHSKKDTSVAFAAAEKTSRLLKNCTFIPLEDGEHCDDASIQLMMEQILKHQ